MPIALSVVVPPEQKGERLDTFIRKISPELLVSTSLSELSRSRVQYLIKTGQIHVDKKIRQVAFRLRGGERIDINIPEPEPLDLVKESIALSVLYEDKHLIAIAKPAGLVVHPGAGRRSGTLVNALLSYCKDLSGIGGVERPGIVHRLDRDTSGVILVAKHDHAHVQLAHQFSRRQIRKEYIAFTIGVPRPPQTTIRTFFARHPQKRKQYSSKVAKGRIAITYYKVLANRANISMLQIKPKTGRTHQIRVHLADRGYPVVGDAIYGGKRWQRIRDHDLRTVAQSLNRHALHAHRITLQHPISKQELVLEAELPDDLHTLAQAITAIDGS